MEGFYSGHSTQFKPLSILILLLTVIVNGTHRTSIWEKENDPSNVIVIDQRSLPFEFDVFCIDSLEKACFAIEEMIVRGAPLIGITAAYGLYIHSLQLTSDWSTELKNAGERLCKCRPTAVNLSWAVSSMLNVIASESTLENTQGHLLSKARELYENDIVTCRSIGNHGLKIIEEIYRSRKETVNILTHCNAGWLATIDWGTATSPIYHAHKKGIPVHVWVDETRPRNQGANLTSYELNEEEVPNTIIADNTGGILMQRGEVNICIVGTDRTLSTGDVANKIGTYLKALAAKDNSVPFYVALPSSTIDWETKDFKDIPIEERNSEELSHVEGLDENNNVKKVLIYPRKSKAINLAFDVTPAKYVTGLITEKGICDASKKGLKKLFK